MDRGRHARSVSRSRSRREGRRESMQSSHESLAGNLSPGRHHHGHHGRGRENSGGGFFKSLFGRREKHPQEVQHPQHPGDVSPPPMAMPKKHSSPGEKFKAFFKGSPPEKRSPGVPLGRGPASPEEVKELQQQVQLLSAQLAGYDKMKQQIEHEQRAAHDWKEKFNYQNFKLNLMVDMLVLRVLEQEQSSGSQAR